MSAGLEELLAKARKAADAAEVYWRRVSSTPVTFENNKLKEIQTNSTFGVALRVIKNGRIGFSTTNKEGDWDTLVDNAVAASAYGAPATFDFAPAATPTKVDVYDAEVAAVPVEQMVETGRVYVEAVTTADPQVLAGVQVSRGVREVGVMTSAGFSGTYRRSEYQLFVIGHIVEGQNMLDVYHGDALSSLKVDAKEITQRVIDDLRLGRTNVAIKSGKFTAILTPNAVEQALGPFEACLDGKAIERGISPWRDKLGQTLFSPSFSLYDDTAMSGLASSAAFDDEGVPTQRLALVDRGQLTSFYHDRRTAKALGQQATGTGWRRSLESPPSPSLGHLVILPGGESLASMIKNVRDGVLIDQLMGAWAGNLLAGEVNGNVMLGFKIEDGRLTGRIKDCMFSINAFEAFRKQLIGFSKETRRTWSGTLPWLALDGVSISTKS